MKAVVLLFLILCVQNGFAQDCNCLSSFNATVKQVTENYAGFSDKVTAKNRKAFETFTRNLASRAEKTTDPDSCYVYLKTWTSYFKDRHLRVQLDWTYRKAYPKKAAELNRLVPKTAVRDAPAKDELAKESGLTILSPKTLLLNVPSFEWSEKKILDSLMQAHTKDLQQTENWIIDLRGNAGGTDFTFSGIMPYLYDRPMVDYPGEYLASPGNIKLYTELLKDEDTAEAQKTFIKQLLEQMNRNPGHFVNPYGQDKINIRLDSVYEYPKKIAILIDRGSESSAESFLLLARQSKKVKFYGENSGGVLDYANSQFFDIPCKHFNLVIATSRSKRLPRYPIDNIGIQPDVRIPNETANKIGLIQNLLEKR